MLRRFLFFVALLFAGLPARGADPTPTPASASKNPSQTESDEYTRYELLSPDTAQFHILYEVSATTRSATAFFNPIRKGSEASGERVFDRMTGKPLAFEVVSGKKARETGLPDADLEMDYIRVALARPVPAEGGQARLLIEKTYKDPKSYFREGDAIVFSRSLGIRRNAIVLPPGYELVSCNVPSQIASEADGRVRVSFWNAAPGPAALMIRARSLPR